MSRKKGLKRSVVEWIVIMFAILILIFAGLHKDFKGYMQRIVLLSTSLVKPQIDVPVEEMRDADYDFDLFTLEGYPVSLKAFRGKTIFLNFWSLSCPPCIAEMPNIQSLMNKMDNAEVEFVMITLDKNMEEVKQFLHDKGFTFSVYSIQHATPELYQSSSIPTTYVISPSGKLAVEKHGLADYDNPEFINFLKELSSEQVLL